MPTHTCVKGDTMITIAHEHGFRDWKAIYDDANNAALREKRPDPMVLAEGDEVFVPERVAAEFRLETNTSHTLQLKPLKAHLRLQMRGPTGEPLAGKKYSLELDGEELDGGTTDDEGYLEADIPVESHEKDLTLKLWMSQADESMVSWTLNLGHLEPIDTDEGVRSRLNNLGFTAGAEGEADALKQGVTAFQSAHGLEATGTLDDATRKAIHDAYGL
jgi:hypothetical protein